MSASFSLPPRHCLALLAHDSDLEDLKAKKPRPAKAEYVKRVKALLRTAKAQEVAGNCVGSFRKTCQEVSDKEGRVSRG